MKRTIACIILLAAAGSCFAQGGNFIDNLRNTSNLSTEEIAWYLEHATRSELRAQLDRNGDGIADGTGKEVHEFIERMYIIILCWRERIEQLKRQETFEQRTREEHQPPVI